MNIAFLAPFGIRPKGTLIARMLPLAAALQERAHQVVIIAPPYTNPEDAGRTEIVRGVRIQNVLLPQCGRAMATPFVSLRMASAAREFAPDLIHLFKPKGYGAFAAMLLRITGFPRLFVDTDDREGKGGMNELHPYSLLEKAVYGWQEQFLLKHACAVTAASRELCSFVGEEIGRVPEQLLYLPNCVEEATPGNGLAARMRQGISPAAPVLLLYTRFFEFDQARLHRVLSAVCAEIPDVVILVVGKGRFGEDEQLLAAAQKGGFAANLKVAGWVEPSQLPEYLAAADVAIYPFADTLINRCKCPAKATEIARAGVPLVADRVGQLPEYVVDGVTGILCDPDEDAGMIHGTVRLLRDVSLRQKMGDAARNRILKDFSWQRVAGELETFYGRFS